MGPVVSFGLKLLEFGEMPTRIFGGRNLDLFKVGAEIPGG